MVDSWTGEAENRLNVVIRSVFAAVTTLVTWPWVFHASKSWSFVVRWIGATLNRFEVILLCSPLLCCSSFFQINKQNKKSLEDLNSQAKSERWPPRYMSICFAVMCFRCMALMMKAHISGYNGVLITNIPHLQHHQSTSA